MAILHVQSVAATNQGGATNSVSKAITPHAAGNLLLVASGDANGTGSTLSISDTAGNTWTPAVAQFRLSGTGSMAAWYAYANGTSATTITITSSSSGNFVNILGDEFSGTATSSPIDQTNGHTGSGTPQVVAQTVTADNELVWGASNDSITAVGSGFTKGADDTAQDWSEYKILSGGNGTSQQIKFTGSGSYLCLMVTVFPAGGGTLFTQNLSDSVTLAEDIAKASARSLSDPISLGESIARQTGKLLADPYSLSDSISRNIGKAVTDPFSLADSIARSPARGLTETFSVTDSLAKQAARVLSDAFSLSDALSAIKTKVLALSDTFSLSDTLARQTGKSLADAVTIAETFFRSTTLALADTFTLSEAFSAIKTKILNLSDAFTVSDSLARANAKLLVDPVTVTDHAIQANITPLHPVLSDQNTYIGTGFAEWGSIFNPNIGGG